MEWSDKITVYNSDCLEAMKDMKDNEFDLAMVDPPYFSGPEKKEYYGSKISSHGVKRIDYKPLKNTWSVPNQEYYNELVRISKQQIIWGVNYFDFITPVGRIVWDKCNDKSDYSDCEIASCSLIKSVRIFRYMWNGMLQGSKGNGRIMEGRKYLNEKKIHPTQKPTQLYNWLLDNYAKWGDKILDTHMGSGSIAISCHERGFDLTAFELDESYYKSAFRRFKRITSQTQLF